MVQALARSCVRGRGNEARIGRLLVNAFDLDARAIGMARIDQDIRSFRNHAGNQQERGAVLRKPGIPAFLRGCGGCDRFARGPFRNMNLEIFVSQRNIVQINFRVHQDFE